MRLATATAPAPKQPSVSPSPNLRLSTVVIGLAEIAHLEEALAAEEMGALPEEGMAELRGVWGRGI